ncbi:hypothetical protein ACOSQ3_022542 [Xanthoceras sorbifolium]
MVAGYERQALKGEPVLDNHVQCEKPISGDKDGTVSLGSVSHTLRKSLFLEESSKQNLENTWVVKDNEEGVPGLNSVELELSKEAHAYANYATSYEVFQFNCPGSQTMCNQSSTIAHPNEGSQPPSRHIAVSLVKAEAKKRWKRLFIRKLDLQLDKALQNHSGHVLMSAAASSSSCFSPLVLEALSLKLGLELARDASLSRLVIKSDCVTLV